MPTSAMKKRSKRSSSKPSHASVNSTLPSTRPAWKANRARSRSKHPSATAVFDANVLGTLLAMKHELRVMTAQQRGSIVNVSSTMGLRGAAGMSIYAASKHAVEGLTKSAALEAAASGVRVNAVAPGPIDTEMLTRLTGSSERKAAMLSSVPLKRAGTPGEIAEAIVFVGSDKAGYMTGEILRVNGGRTA